MGLRTGLLGYGIAGRVFHAPLIAATSGLELSAVVTADPVRREQALAAHPGVDLPHTAEELFALDLDLVVVATPNRTHVPLALAAIEAGLPVVVDKPFAPTSADARRVLQAARYRSVPVTVFQNRRWDSDFRTIRSLVADGALGAVTRFESRFERWVPEVWDNWREFGAAEEAGGLLYDLGAHLVDQALELFGPVSSVYAELDLRRPGVEVDDDVFVALTHLNGVRSHLWAGSAAPHHGPRFRVLGTTGAYVSHGLDRQEDALSSGKPFDDLSTSGELGLLTDVQEVVGLPGAYSEFYRLLVAALAGDGPLPVEPESAVYALEVIEAAFTSARTGQVVSL
ncbi:Gfo/Idh/MocA family protein [Saccharothrix deserti]|uniref:Gfo/Idh/MocA family protein n=1 Tax=Saccharothrix deserti TaxID=2593674 RepID=UPI00131D64BB|nr:Gfo/Idh/MocA family oxidoreductase [Saccharothrix deserti]